jgi:chemotaxis methyl-accepting protein methylase
MKSFTMCFVYDTVRVTGFDCDSSRLGNSSGVIYQREEATLMSELESQSDSVLREWSSLLEAHAKEKGWVVFQSCNVFQYCN